MEEVEIEGLEGLEGLEGWRRGSGVMMWYKGLYQVAEGRGRGAFSGA